MACIALAGAAALLLPGGLQAQNAADTAAKAHKHGTKLPLLFRSASPVALTFTANLRQLRHDQKENSPWRWGTLSYQDSAGKTVAVPMKVRTRGIWRLKHCSFPPIRLNFAKETSKHTLFDDLDQPKLVNYCQDDDKHEQYILQELQLYRIYQLLTPASHRVRLVRMSYVDSASGKREAERYAFISEDPGALAARLGAKPVKVKGAGPSDFDPDQLALAYLFQYFIGNLDFSWAGLHNTEVLATEDGRVLPVAYDFDYAGAVNAWYAVPPPNYGVPNVRTRKFLAPCEIAPQFSAALERFIQQKDSIYALYHDEVGQLMSPKTVRETLQYFDDFYNDVRTPADAKRKVFDRCIQAR